MTSDERDDPRTYDADGGAIDRVLEMPAGERQRRLGALRSRVHAADGESWIEDQLRTVDAVTRQEVTRGRTTAVSNR